MIVTRRISLRIALILVATVVVQVSFFSYLSFLGVVPDVVPTIGNERPSIVTCSER